MLPCSMWVRMAKIVMWNRRFFATSFLATALRAKMLLRRKKKVNRVRRLTASVVWQLVSSALKIKSKRNAKWCMYASWPDAELVPLTKAQIIDVAESLPCRKWIADRQDCDDAARRLYCAVRAKYPTGAFAYATMEAVPYLDGPHALNIAVIREFGDPIDPLKIVMCEPQRVGEDARRRLLRWPRDGYIVRELHF